MRSELIRLYKTVHTWSGITTGLLLFVAFYAGAITMFELPLARWLAPPTTQRAALTPLADAASLIRLTLAARPDAAREFTLHLTDREDVPARLTWSPDRESPLLMSASLAADGALQTRSVRTSSLPEFIDQIHRTGGIPGDPEIGVHVMGVIGLVYAVALISGVIVLLPSLVKDFFALRLGKNLKRMWLDAHNVIGIVSLPFHLFMALTAIVFGLHDQFYDTQDHLIYGGRLRPIMQASNPGFAPPSPTALSASMLAPTDLLRRVADIAPGFTAEAMSYRGANSAAATVRISGHDDRFLVRGSGFAQLDAVSGKILSTEYLPGHQSSWSTVVSSFFALHFGSFGGTPIRWSYFFLGLAGAFLFYTGNLLWVETRRRSERRAAGLAGPISQRRATRWMAAATVGVSLGCIAGISFSIAAGKWLYLDLPFGFYGAVDNLDTWHRGIYYAVFVASLVWAFWRGAAAAAVGLLWLAAAAMMAIPAASLLAYLFPASGMWVHGSIAALAVDMVAAVASLCFVWIAHATRRRVVEGAADSVWSWRAVA